MKTIMLSIMLITSTATFAAEEVKSETPAAEPTVVDQAKDVATDAKDAVVETADGVWGWVKGLFN